MSVFEEEQMITRVEILKHNIQKIALISKLSTIVSLFLMIIIPIVSNITDITRNGTIVTYVIPYILLVLFNVFFYFLSGVRKIDITEKNMNKIDLFIYVYVVGLTFIGSLISITDIDFYNQLMIFTLFLFIIASVFVLSTKQLIITMFVSSATVLLGLYNQNVDSMNYKQQVLYIFTLIPITFFISRSFFHSFHRSLKFQSELMKEAHITRELTKKLREANRKLELQATLDPLTNLYNRRAYNEYVKDLEKRTNYEPFKFSTIMVDVDCFKLFNDTYGHTEGDYVLASIGQKLYEIADKYGCFASRWGGEEFTLFLLNRREEVVNNICEEIIQNVKALKISHCSSVIDEYVTVSIGACSQEISNPSDIKECIKNADKALYYVKENGRNFYVHKQNLPV